MHRIRRVLPVLLLVFLAAGALAQACVPPARPFVPTDLQAVEEFADLIRDDFEIYIEDIQNYFRCLDDERARAFEEARDVSEDYGRFVDLVGR